MTEPSEEEEVSPGLDLRKGLIRGVWSLGLAAGVLLLLFLAVWRLDPRSVGLQELLLRSDPALLALGVGLISLAPVAMALRWRALLPGRGHPVLPLSGFMCVGILFNYALPGPVGELVAAMLAAKRCRLALADTLATLAVGRVLGLGLAASLAGTIYLFAPVGISPQVRQVALGASVLLLLVALTLGAAALWPQLPRRLLYPALDPLSRLPGRLGRLGGRLHRGVDQLAAALARVARRGWRAWLESAAWALAGHLSVASGIALAARGMGMEPPWSGVVFTYASSTAGAVVLFLFPGSQVGWDLSFGTILALTTGLGPTDAAALTVVVRLQHSLVVLVGVWATWLAARPLLATSE